MEWRSRRRGCIKIEKERAGAGRAWRRAGNDGGRIFVGIERRLPGLWPSPGHKSQRTARLSLNPISSRKEPLTLKEHCYSSIEYHRHSQEAKISSVSV